MKINKQLFQELSKKRYLSYIRSLPDIKNEKTQMYIILILTFFAFSFFGIFAITPTLSTIAQLQKSLEDRKFIHTQLETKIKNMTLLQQEYNLLNPQLPLIFAAIPQNPEVVKLVGQIQTLFSNAGISTSSINLQQIDLLKRNPGAKLESFNFVIVVEGTYDQLQRFYNDLIAFDRIILVKDITIIRLQEGSSTLKMTINAQAYYKL
ncbi:MAG: hypothetical protein KatS3mg089_0103 [Patescibacteria group bacterium]|nr:MAG: hypothetical protein KatS3mg089_0103 [Patescibacteria group bacterium]